MAAGDGLISMAPTSIAYSGTSASINADGGVDFSAVTSLSLNGVFTSDYDNYLVVLSHSSTDPNAIRFRLRLSGTDASGSDYVRQSLNVTSTTVQGARTSSLQQGTFGSGGTDVNANGTHGHFYGPALSQPTAYRGVDVRGASGAAFQDEACTHSLSTSYDGLTLFPTAGSFTGTVHVFGYEE